MHAGVQELDEGMRLEWADEGTDVLQTLDIPNESDLTTPLETRTSQPVEDTTPITADLPIGGGKS